MTLSHNEVVLGIDLLLLAILCLGLQMWADRHMIGEIHKVSMSREEADALFMSDDDDDDEIEEEGEPSEDDSPIE